MNATEAVEEVPCVDCGCDLIRDPERPASEQRCDTDEAHHARQCGPDCPVICDACHDHHFDDFECDQRQVAKALLLLLEIEHLTRAAKWAPDAAAAKRMLGVCKLCGELGCKH